MQRDRALIVALGGALLVLLSLVFGGHPATSSVDAASVRAGRGAPTQLVAAIAARTLRLRPAQRELSPEPERRVAGGHDGTVCTDAMPVATAVLASRGCTENLSRPPALSPGPARASCPAAHRHDARAPPV